MESEVKSDIQKFKKTCKQNFVGTVRNINKFIPFKISKKSNDKQNSQNDINNYYCTKRERNSKNGSEKHFCTRSKKQKNSELLNTSINFEEHSLSPVIENTSGKWEVENITENNQKRGTNSDELYKLHSQKQSRRHVNLNNISISVEKLALCKNRKNDIKLESSKFNSKYDSLAKIENDVSNHNKNEINLESKDIFSKYRDFNHGPKMVNTSEDKINMKNVLSCSQTNEAKDFSFKSNESFINPSDYSFDHSSSVSYSTPNRYLSKSADFFNYREKKSIFTPSPVFSVNLYSNNSYDPLFSTPKRSFSQCKHFQKNKLAPVYKSYQLIGDSQLVRFSQQILNYRHVDYTPDTHSRFIGLCISGQTIEALLNRIKKKEYSVTKNIILMIGTNNLKQNTKLSFMVDNMNLLVNEIKMYADKLVILTVPPIPLLEHQEKHWMVLETFNNFLMNYNNGIDVFVIDLAKYYTLKPHVCKLELFERAFGNSRRPDLIHLNYEGLRILEKCLNTCYFNK